MVSVRRIGLIGGLVVLSLAAAAVAATPGAWEKLTFLRYKAVTFRVTGPSVAVDSRDASSLLYRPIAEADRSKKFLRWSWRVEASSVTPTRLDVAPGDDRMLGMYVFFTKKPMAAEADLPTDGNYLAYVWGSVHPVGTVLNSPDGRGKIKVIRAPEAPQKTWLQQTVPYQHDFAAAFGYTGYPAFIAIASDSDDTDATTIAAVKNLIFTDAP